MKLPCKVVEDILPMYYDKVCSEESAALVEAHLKDCPLCSRMLANLGCSFNIPDKAVDDIKPLKKLQKSYSRKRLCWLIAILCVVALIPAAFLIGSDYSKRIAGYSQKEALSEANAFMTCLAEGDYAEAFSYWDMESKKHEWLRNNDFVEADLANLETDGLKKFCELGESKVEALGGIESFALVSISDNGYDYRGNKAYHILYSVRFDGKEEDFWIGITENGVHTIGAADGYLKHPLAQLCVWGHWLYDDYLGRYYDYDLKEYVYYGKKPE